MRLGTVIGRVTLSVGLPSLKGARWLVVSPFSRAQYQEHSSTTPAMSTPAMSKEPSLVVYDNLGGGLGETIGFVEGREAAYPFDPPVPIDAVNAALVDEIYYRPFKR